MSLKFILGPAGSGKTTRAFMSIIEASLKDSERSLNSICDKSRKYLVLVPEQFSLQTQIDLSRLHPRHGSMDIDVISFERLAWLVLEEICAKAPVLLDGLGQLLVLRNSIDNVAENLGTLKRNIRKPGFTEELKDLITELNEYQIGHDELVSLRENFKDSPLLADKLSDLILITDTFRNNMGEKSIPQEEMLHYFSRFISSSDLLKGSSIVLDGYTGFTPNQCDVIKELLKTAESITVTLTFGAGLRMGDIQNESDVFYPTKVTYDTLCDVAKDAGTIVEEPEYLTKLYRFENAPALASLSSGFGRFGVKDNLADGAVKIVSAKDPKEESRFIAEKISELVRAGIRYRDIAVICSDITVYDRYMLSEFKIQNIPAFIDNGRTLDKNPFVRFVLSLFEPSERGYTHESMFRLFKSGFIDAEDDSIDLLENYVLQYGIRGYSKWKKDWLSDEECYANINELKAKAANDVLELTANLKSQNSVSGILELLRRYLENLNAEEKLDLRAKEFEEASNFSLSKEYEQIWRLTLELFERIDAVLGQQSAKSSDVKDLLREGFAQIRAGVIPQSADSVLVGDLARSRVGDIKVLFFAGFNDGLLPKSGNEGGILSDLERDRIKRTGIKLRPTVHENSVLQKLRTYQNMTRPRKQLFITYSFMNEKGKKIYPSSYLSDVKAVFEKIETYDTKELQNDRNAHMTLEAARHKLAYNFDAINSHETDEYRELYSWFFNKKDELEFLNKLRHSFTYRYNGEKLSADTAEALIGKVLSGSASRLESYSSCAFKWFLQYALGLKEHKQYSFDFSDAGNIFHAALENYFTRMIKEGFGYSQTDSERKKTVKECVKEAVAADKTGILTDGERNVHLADRMSEIVDRTVWALVEQGKMGDFVPEDAELGFSSGDTKAMNIVIDEEHTLRMTGKIDRVDVFDDGEECLVKVIDYKSGEKELDLTLVYYGLQIQLLLYLDAIMEKKKLNKTAKRIVPAATLYFHIQDAWTDATELLKNNEAMRDEALLDKYKMTGAVNGSPDIIEHFVCKADDPDVIDHIIDVKTKDGEIEGKKGTEVFNTETFGLVNSFVRNNIKITAQKMLSGEVSANPYIYGSNDPCRYCSFKSVCIHDKHAEGFKPRRLEKISLLDILGEDEV